ncbi:hypothetical protein EI555_012363, partial [Monodon monoceros]
FMLRKVVYAHDESWKEDSVTDWNADVAGDCVCLRACVCIEPLPTHVQKGNTKESSKASSLVTMMVSLNAGASGSRRVDGWELTVQAGGRGDQHDWGSAGMVSQLGQQHGTEIHVYRHRRPGGAIQTVFLRPGKTADLSITRKTQSLRSRQQLLLLRCTNPGKVSAAVLDSGSLQGSRYAGAATRLNRCSRRDKQRKRQKRETETEKDRGRQRQTHRDRERRRLTYTQRKRHTQRQSQRPQDRQLEREMETERDIQRDRDRHRETHRERQRDRGPESNPGSSLSAASGGLPTPHKDAPHSEASLLWTPARPPALPTRAQTHVQLAARSPWDPPAEALGHLLAGPRMGSEPRPGLLLGEGPAQDPQVALAGHKEKFKFGLVKPSGGTLVLTNCYFHRGNPLAKCVNLGSTCNMLFTINSVHSHTLWAALGGTTWGFFTSTALVPLTLLSPSDTSEASNPSTVKPLIQITQNWFGSMTSTLACQRFVTWVSQDAGVDHWCDRGRSKKKKSKRQVRLLTQGGSALLEYRDGPGPTVAIGGRPGQPTSGDHGPLPVAREALLATLPTAHLPERWPRTGNFAHLLNWTNSTTKPTGVAEATPLNSVVISHFPKLRVPVSQGGKSIGDAGVPQGPHDRSTGDQGPRKHLAVV